MPLEELRKSIESEAKESAKMSEREADEEVEKILHAAKEKANKIEKDAEAEAKAETERMWKEHEASLEIEINNKFIEAREDVISAEMVGVEEEAAKIIENEHMEEILKMAIKSFGEAMPKEELTIKTRKENSKMVGNLGAKVEYIEIEGFTIYSKDRKIFLSVTPDGIMKSNKDIVRNVVAHGIFGKEIDTYHSDKKRKKG